MNIFVPITYLGLGIALGVLYFGGLWWNTRLLAEGGRLRTLILATIGRFALLGGILVLTSLQGAMPLLFMAVGIFAARFLLASRLRTP